MDNTRIADRFLGYKNTIAQLQKLFAETPTYTLDNGRRYKENLPAIVCVDGTEVSVQASAGHYCLPRNNEGPYSKVEVGYPTSPPPATWNDYGDQGNVWGYVPIELVAEYIWQHGGIK